MTEYDVKPERVAAYKALDSERDYQDAGVADVSRLNMKPLDAGEIILAMEQCLTTARAAWYSDAHPYPHTAEYVRKVGGLAVQFMERYGAPQREGFER